MSRKSTDGIGKKSCIRPLGLGEREAHLAHLLRLDPASRRFRFNGYVCDATIQAHCLSLMQRQCVILGAFVMDCLRGAVELVPITDNDRRTVELAFSVEREFQGLGLGSVLFAAALERLGPRDAVMVCERDNIGMQRLAALFGATRQVEGNQIFLTATACDRPQIEDRGDVDLEHLVLLGGYV